MKIKFIFFGTPKPAADILLRLKERDLVPSLVVTNPDRPQGRHMTPTPPPVKVWAQKNGIPVLQLEPLSDSDFLYKLKAKSYQLFLVVAYGGLLPKSVLDIPKHGTLNVHYSLLPNYRGATPIESQILNDDREVGISIILLDEKMDHGQIVAQQRLQIFNPSSLILNEEVNRGKGIHWPPKASELRAAMNALAGEMLAEVLPKWVEGNIQAKEQAHARATYTKKFTKADGEIDLTDDPYKNFLKIQAFEDSIGTYFFVRASDSPSLKGALPSPACTETSAGRSAGGLSKKNNPTRQPPLLRGITTPASEDGGTPFIKGDKIRVLVKSAEFKDGKLNILRVVPEGKKEMSYEEFLRGMK